MHALFDSVERFKLSTKLMLGFSIGILVAVVIGLNALFSLSAIEATTEKIYANDLLGISAIKDAHINLIYMGRALRQMIIAQDDASRDLALASIKRSRERLLQELGEARRSMFRSEIIAAYDKLALDLNRVFEITEQAVGMIQRDRGTIAAVAQFVTSKEFAAIIATADDGLSQLVDMKEKAAGTSLDLARAHVDGAKQLSIILLLLGIFVAGLMGIVISRSIHRPYDGLRHSVEELAEGKVDASIPYIDYSNEIGVMARAVRVLQDVYRKANEQHWVKLQVSEVSNVLQKADNFRNLTQSVVSTVASAIGAGHGAFYVMDEEGNLGLLASYGYRERKQISNSFRIGEGLVGQCAMEKVPIMLTAPKDYIRINSGLGAGPPACIIVLPIIHNDRVLGVLEMASFQPFNERENAVLDALLPIMATSMEILDRNLKTRELLVATQEQAERMEKQAAQLEEQTVEMEAQQAELLETENWFRSIIETAPNGMLVVDTAGRILLANPELERIFGYAPGELLGDGIEKLVPERVRGGHIGLRYSFMVEGRSRPMGGGAPLRGLRKDGSELSVTITLNPLPSRGTRGKCVSVAVREIEK
ncbi:MAG: PAS domain S-box protein [Magnetococcus sp. YQC-5]